jgi:hypothetical protein
MTDIRLYRKYLEQYISEAFEHSDGTISGVSEYLGTITVSGILTRHKEEKKRALEDARTAFNEHRHWPMDIIISHLGLDPSIMN